MEIWKATPGDLEGIRAVYAAAKAFMDAHGNASQWEPGYPDSVIPGDIANGNCYAETLVRAAPLRDARLVCVPFVAPDFNKRFF
mgnify:CR=1 FL=1